jgi:hypothetical protein
MLFSTKVLEFWIMETINIYDFLHLLSLIKIRHNMNFGEILAFAHICHKTLFFFFQGEWKNTHVDKLKQIGERHTMTSIHLFVSLS